MNAKGIAAVCAIIGILLLLILLPTKPEDIPPAIQDSVEIKEDSKIEINSADITEITDSIMIQNKTEIEFYVDENGTKHYILNITDVPKLGND